MRGTFRMITEAMMGLISTPVTSLLPEASARDTSHPPPGPMTRVFAAGRSMYGKPWSVILQVEGLLMPKSVRS